MQNEKNKNQSTHQQRNFNWLSSWRTFSQSTPIRNCLRLFRNALFILTSLPLILGIAALSGFNSSILADRAYAEGLSSLWPTITQEGGAETSWYAGAGDYNLAYAFKYTNQTGVPVNLCTLKLPLKKVGSPDGAISIYLVKNGATPDTNYGSYPNQLLGSQAVANLNTSFADWNITLSNCLTLSTTDFYWFEMRSTESYSLTDYISTPASGYSNAGSPANLQFWTKTIFDGWEQAAPTGLPILNTNGFNNLAGITIPASTTLLSGFYSGLASTLQDCSIYSGGFFSSSTLQALGCYAQNTVETFVDILFIPSSSSTGVILFQSSLQNLTSVFPFDIFTSFTGAINTNLTNYTVTDNSITLTLPSPTPGTFTVNSSTISTFLGSSTWSTIRTYESAGIWTVSGMAIIFTII